MCVRRRRPTGEQAQLEPFELGELLDQLLHAVTNKLYGKLGIFAVSIAREDDAFAILWVPDAGSFAEASAAGRGGNVHAGATFEAATFAEEGRSVVEWAAAGAWATLAEPILRMVMIAPFPDGV